MVMVQNADRTSQPLFTKYATPTEWPWTLVTVVSEARRIISYLENLPEDTQPPKNIWHSQHKCTAWIKEHQSSDRRGSGMLEFDDREVERANG